MHKIKLLESFACLGADCEDTCCKDWSMQCNSGCQTLYKEKAPELLDALEESDVGLIMKKDPDSGYCERFSDGICSIHSAYGDSFLGDACHFFPRSVRGYGDEKVMSASLSCPEVVRLGVVGNASWQWQSVPLERLPEAMKNYAVEGMATQDVLATIELFQRYVREASDTCVSEKMLHLCSVGASLAAHEQHAWNAAAKFYLFKMPAMISTDEKDPLDAHKLLQALLIVMSAMPRAPRERLLGVVGVMAAGLAVEIVWDDLTLTFLREPEQVVQEIKAAWQEHAVQIDGLMQRWLEAQLSIAGLPFSGFGDTVQERFEFLAVRFALTKTALLLHAMQGQASDEDSVRVVQVLARAMDHLADPKLSRAVFNDMRWLRPARLAGLLRCNI